MSGTHIALVSGGMDSAVAASVAHETQGMELLAYLDTGTGLEANRHYLETLADHLGLQLWTLRTHESYEDLVRENGFPGGNDHSIMYRCLKERQVRKLATVVNGRGTGSNLHLWTGVRRSESRNRMGRVQEIQEAERWTWHAPLHDWTKQDTRDYVQDRGIPENPIWSELGRSGDCFCGAFASPAEKLDLLAAGYEGHAEWIGRLEEVVEDLHPGFGERCVWGWTGLSKNERRSVRAEKDENQMILCSDCGPPEEPA